MKYLAQPNRKGIIICGIIHMEKTDFIELMNRYIELGEDVEKVDTALKTLSPDWGRFSIHRADQLILDLLKITMNDRYEYISYWLFELDKGKLWTKNSVRDENGNTVKLKTLSDLYDVITSNVTTVSRFV